MAIPNPVVIENYRGFVIRRYTKIQVRVNVTEAKKIIDAKLDFGMSAREAIVNKKILCPDCNTAQIVPIRNIYAESH